jgi:hypothetical protein
MTHYILKTALDFESIGAARDELLPLVQSGEDVTIEVPENTRLTVVGLQLLISLAKTLQRKGRTLSVVEATGQGQMSRLIEGAGIADLPSNLRTAKGAE